eukprot:5712500-Pyramimonas_sp.AAC.1
MRTCDGGVDGVALVDHHHLPRPGDQVTEEHAHHAKRNDANPRGPVRRELRVRVEDEVDVGRGQQGRQPPLQLPCPNEPHVRR